MPLPKLLSTRETTPPAISTPLTPGRPNLGKEAQQVARVLGYERLADWQYDFLCLATEYEEGDPYKGGIVPYYRYVTGSCPRQCGKSECLCSVLYMLRWEGYYRQEEAPKMFYTAHALEAVLDMWDTKAGRRMRESEWGVERDFWVSHDGRSPHARLGERDRNLTGGRIRFLTNSGKSGRGGSEDMGVMDETREFGDESEREKTLDPLMNMRPAPQLFNISTMGVETSGFWNRKVHAGRELARAQCEGNWPRLRAAYIEYGVGDVKPDSYDPSDPALWHRAHPMLGWGHWSVERMAEKYDIARSEDDLERFQQEYLNQMFAAVDEPALPWNMLDAAERDEIKWEDLGENVILAVFAEPGSHWVSAVAVGNARVKVVRPVQEDGQVYRVPVHSIHEWLTRWLPDHPQVRHLAYQEGNELEHIAAQFKNKGQWIRKHSLKFADYKFGCSGLNSAIVAGEAAIERSPYLRIAVAASERTEGYDQASWYWRRKPKAQAGADELRAAVLAWLVWTRVGKMKTGSIVMPDPANLTGEDAERMAQWMKAYGGG